MVDDQDRQKSTILLDDSNSIRRFLHDMEVEELKQFTILQFRTVQPLTNEQVERIVDRIQHWDSLQVLDYRCQDLNDRQMACILKAISSRKYKQGMKLKEVTLFTPQACGSLTVKAISEFLLRNEMETIMTLMGRFDLGILQESLKINTSLVSLSLYSCKLDQNQSFGDRELYMLSEILCQSHNTIRKLHITGNKFSPEAMTHFFVDKLPQMKGLQDLCLGRNDHLHQTTVVGLLVGIKANRSLYKFHITPQWFEWCPQLVLYPLLNQAGRLLLSFPHSEPQPNNKNNKNNYNCNDAYNDTHGCKTQTRSNKNIQQTKSLPLGLWTKVIHRITQDLAFQKENKSYPSYFTLTHRDVLYHMLQELPPILFV